MQRRTCPRAYVRLHGRIPGNRGPCSTFRRTSPERRGEMYGAEMARSPFPQDRDGAAHARRLRHQIARPVIMKVSGAAMRKQKAMR